MPDQVKSINEHDPFSGLPTQVNILVQEKSQTEPAQYLHKRTALDAMIEFYTDPLTKRVNAIAVPGGTIPKGNILSSNLPAASSSNYRWEYYLTDLNRYAISNGSEWIYFDNIMVVQIPDEADTSHALSNAKTTQMNKELTARFAGVDFRNREHYGGPVDLFVGPGEDAIRDHSLVDILEHENGGEGHMVDLMEKEEDEADALIIVAESAKPTSSSSPGQRGWVYEDSNYLYVCVATNSWKRVALSTF